MNPNIFVALSNFGQVDPRPLELLKESGVQIHLNTTGKRLTKEEVVKEAARFEGIIAGLEPYDKDVLGQLPKLKCISRCGVGIDNIDTIVAKQKDIAVFNTPYSVIQAVAELTIGMIFDLLRKITLQTQSMRSSKWERMIGSQLAGKKVGIIGLGRIGRKTAEILQKLGAQVCGYDIKPDLQWSAANHIAIVSLEKLLQESDIVSLHVSPDPTLPFCLGPLEISQMKKGAFLVNTSRGSAIDEKALLNALQNNALSGAALDVFSQEPYLGPLNQLTNVIVTPHIATFTQESRLEMEMEAVQNLLSFFKHGKKGIL
jgi:D-3-phosphoglycerate dehydrogenase